MCCSAEHVGTCWLPVLARLRVCVGWTGQSKGAHSSLYGGAVGSLLVKAVRVRRSEKTEVQDDGGRGGGGGIEAEVSLRCLGTTASYLLGGA